MRYIWKLMRKNAQLRKENRELIRALREERALTRDVALAYYCLTTKGKEINR